MIPITVIGACGRMGKEIIKLIAVDNQLCLAGAIDTEMAKGFGYDAGINSGIDKLGINISNHLTNAIPDSEVIIDFSSPHAVLNNTKTAIEGNCSTVIGTTGFSEEVRSEIESLAASNGKIVMAPNMSIGVNLLFLLCRRAAEILDNDFDIEVVEMHHNQKQDAPSGTAEQLGRILAEQRNLSYANDTKHGRFGLVGERTSNEIGIHSIRGGDVVGDHQVIFAADGERFELVHKASSRTTFAKGAIRAAKFIVDAKPGIYDMQQVLGL